MSRQLGIFKNLEFSRIRRKIKKYFIEIVLSSIGCHDIEIIIFQVVESWNFPDFNKIW